MTESASRMLTYALMLGLSGQLAKPTPGSGAHGRGSVTSPQPRAEDVATFDVLRLFTFAVTAEAGDEIDPGRRRSRRSRRVSTWASAAPGRG